MGDTFQKLGDLDATADEAPGLAASVSARLIAEDVVSGELTDCVFVGLGVLPREVGQSRDGRDLPDR